MTEGQSAGMEYVIGPRGRPLTVADLPPSTKARWVSRRKAEIVAAVRGGLLSLDDAQSRYQLSIEEINTWQRAFDRHGIAGLRVKRIQHGRRAALM
jgi:transposase